MKKILIPIDFSENTDNALNVACDLAVKLNCEIILLHSYFEIALLQSINTIHPDETMPVVTIDPGLFVLKQTTEEELNKLAQKVRSNYSFSVETNVSSFELREMIDDVREKNDVLMIVMSATGTGKKDSFTGSVASSLFDNTPVPILAIPDGYKYDEAGFNNILYATSFAEAAQSEVRFILENFIYGDSRLNCCHLRFPDNDDLLEDAQMLILSQPFAAEVKSGKVSFDIIDADDAEKALEDLVEQRNIGLISFHEHNRGFFYRFFHKSVVKKDIYRFDIPLLVFRKF